MKVDSQQQVRHGTDEPPTPLERPDGGPAIADWSLDPSVRHLNHASYGGVPTAAQDAQSAYHALMEKNPAKWFRELPERVATAREQLAALFHTDIDQTALIPNASSGVTVACNCLVWRPQPGGHIVMTDHAYGAVRMAVERLARRWDVPIVTVHVPLEASREDALGRVTEEIHENTALVVVDQVTSATARYLPAADVARYAKERGVRVLVDGAHAPGIHEYPTEGIGADIWVGNLHKFACAPRGTALIVANPAISPALYPPIDSWGAPDPFPRRFDRQGTIDMTSYLAAPAAVNLVQDHYGWPRVRRYTKALLDYAQPLINAALTSTTGEDAAVTQERPVPAIRLFRLPHDLVTDPAAAHDLQARISAEARIECAITYWDSMGFLRLSAHAYNTPADYEAFIERAIPVMTAGRHALGRPSQSSPSSNGTAI